MENVKKLQRDTQHSVIGGVCSGLANYLGIDVVLVRLLFVVAFLVFGTGFLVYLIMWLVMPAGNSAPARANYYSTPNGDAVEAEVVAEEVPQEKKQEDKNNPEPNKKGSLIAGLVLIGLGALGLLHRFVPEFNWSTAWPVLLIILGIFFLLPPKNKES